jgi:TIR domain
MAETESVFISHANDDKVRIKFIADFLMTAGFRLFIDHPEKIPGIDPDLVDSLWDTRDNVDDAYDKQLKKAIRECDCVLGILSENTTSEKATLRGEMERGDQLNKLILCKIAPYSADVLSGFTNKMDVANLEVANPAAQQDETLRRLSQKITGLITANRETRMEKISERIVAGGGDPMTEKWREIRHILPLCVGRDDQRRAIRKAARQSEETGQIVPVVIVGPENELPDQVVESLRFESLIDESNAGKIGFVEKRILWPRGKGAAFANSYLEWLAKAVCNDDLAGQPDIVRTLATIGHNVVLVSTLDVANQGLDVAEVASWAAFWKGWSAGGQLGQKLVPVLNLVFGPAKAGWDLIDPRVPPTRSEDAATHDRNVKLLAGLLIAPAAGETGFVSPQFTPPIRREQFWFWADSINNSILDSEARMTLRTIIADQQFQSADALRDGVSHRNLYNAVVKWFDDKRAIGG